MKKQKYNDITDVIREAQDERHKNHVRAGKNNFKKYYIKGILDAFNKVNKMINERIKLNKACDKLDKYSEQHQEHDVIIAELEVLKAQINNQLSIGDNSSMSLKVSIRRQCDKITSCPRDESCKPKTLADIHSQQIRRHSVQDGEGQSNISKTVTDGVKNVTANPNSKGKNAGKHGPVGSRELGLTSPADTKCLMWREDNKCHSDYGKLIKCDGTHEPEKCPYSEKYHRGCFAMAVYDQHNWRKK